MGLALLQVQVFSFAADSASGECSNSADIAAPSHAKALLQKSTRQNSTTASVGETTEHRRDHARQFVSLLSKAKPKKGDLKADKVDLSESGYKTIAATEDSDEMAAFVTRVAEELGYEITSPAKLNGVVPYYNGKKAKQTFAALKHELAKTSLASKGWAKKAGAASSGDDDDDDDGDKEDKGDDDDDKEEKEEGRGGKGDKEEGREGKGREGKGKADDDDDE